MHLPFELHAGRRRLTSSAATLIVTASPCALPGSPNGSHTFQTSSTSTSPREELPTSSCARHSRYASPALAASPPRLRQRRCDSPIASSGRAAYVAHRIIRSGRVSAPVRHAGLSHASPASTLLIPGSGGRLRSRDVHTRGAAQMGALISGVALRPLGQTHRGTRSVCTAVNDLRMVDLLLLIRARRRPHLPGVCPARSGSPERGRAGSRRHRAYHLWFAPRLHQMPPRRFSHTSRTCPTPARMPLRAENGRAVSRLCWTIPRRLRRARARGVSCTYPISDELALAAKGRRRARGAIRCNTRRALPLPERRPISAESRYAPYSFLRTFRLTCAAERMRVATKSLQQEYPEQASRRAGEADGGRGAEQRSAAARLCSFEQHRSSRRPCPSENANSDCGRRVWATWTKLGCSVHRRL